MHDGAMSDCVFVVLIRAHVSYTYACNKGCEEIAAFKYDKV